VDLSAGMDLDAAVRKFEAMVAPANYKRPTALVTPKMIEGAKAKIAEMGLLSALERRHAVLSDITVNNVLWADRAARKVMGGDVFDELAAGTKTTPRNLDRLEEVHIDKFLADIVPRAESIEVFLENHHQGNMVSLITAQDATSGQLFKWDNKFSWSYSGNVADAIKERVKKAGGNVEGELRCSLAWDDKGDLDLHMHEPGRHICYHQRVSTLTGGRLDVDANGLDGLRDDPVENIYYTKVPKGQPGVYRLVVHQYSRRDAGNDQNGFEVEIEIRGEVRRYSYPKPLLTGQTVEVAQIRVMDNGNTVLTSELSHTQSQRTIWGVPTQTFRKVNALLLSPNFWDGQGVGNKHFMFMLDGCVNDEGARGFYNEFLKQELDAHRKVFEMVGAKMKLVPAAEQLSGLGFSSTARKTLVCRVKGSFNRDLKVIF
jgi:hypothetical protein